MFEAYAEFEEQTLSSLMENVADDSDGMLLDPWACCCHKSGMMVLACMQRT